jgi:AbrB family looped-hinge helix DNA binding protein
MVTIQINERGSMTLPKGIRHALGLDHGGSVMAEETNGGILLRPAVSYPIEMYSDDRVREFDDAEKALRRKIRGKARQ